MLVPSRDLTMVRRHCARPPSGSANYIVAEIIELEASHDAVRASLAPPIEPITVGPPVQVLEFLPEHDQAAIASCLEPGEKIGQAPVEQHDTEEPLPPPVSL